MIRSTEWHGLQAVELEAGGYEALLIPSVGANLVKLYHKESGADILRTPDQSDIENFRERPQIYGLPLLFPPNRIEDGKFTFEGRTYNYPITIPAQNNHHHGNIKSQPFVVTRCEDAADHVEVEAVYFSNCVNDAVYSYFPHEFECRMIFRLSDKGLEHTVKFINRSGNNMPLGVGYHTPINVPFIKGSDASSYKLKLSVGEKWELNERTLPTGTKLPLDDNEQQLRKEGMQPLGVAIETAFTAEPIEIEGKSYNGAVMTDLSKNVSVYYEVDGQVKDWTLWNNGGEVPWICPEPQTWAINAPNIGLPDDQTGFQSVAPGATWYTVSKIYVK